MLSQSYLRELKAFHRALGDVTRLRVVQILATEGEFPVSELVRRLRISAPLMSWHLRRLTRAGIVRTERVGREVRCSFDREHFTQMQERSFRALMNRVNPKYVFRNYLAQQAIDALERGDASVLERLMKVLERPYDEQPARAELAVRRPEWARHKAGCSALSCSS